MPQYGTVEWFEQMFSSADLGYDRWGHQWRAIQQHRYLLTLSVIKFELVQTNSQYILDIGCGLGDFTEMVLSTNPHNNLYGMDLSQNAVSGACKKYPRIKFRCGALPDIVYDKKFDGIIALDCIYYLDYAGRKAAFENIFLHVKPKGWFLFSSPLDKGNRYFSKDQATRYMEQAGFKIHKVVYNYAKLYGLLAHPFNKILNVSRIVGESETPIDSDLSFKKKILWKAIRLPVLGYLLKKTITLLERISYHILKSMLLVKAIRFTSRVFLKNQGRSHIIILALKNE